MQIKTQRLTLEPLGTKFLVSTHAYASDPELTRLMVFLPTDDLAETERYLKKCEAEAAKERPQFYEMAVLLDGSVSAKALDDRACCAAVILAAEEPEEGDENWDSGWRFTAGDESDSYMDDPGRSGIYHLNTLCNYDPDIIPLLDSEPGTAWCRDQSGVFRPELYQPDEE